MHLERRRLLIYPSNLPTMISCKSRLILFPCCSDVAPSIARTLFPMSRSLFEPLEPRQLLSVNVAINAAERHQAIDGFGTSLAWYVPNLYDQPAWQSAYYQ